MEKEQNVMEEQIVRRVEQVLIRKGGKYKKLYKFFDKLCFISKNHYNSICYDLRSKFIESDGDLNVIPNFFSASGYRNLNGTQDLIGSDAASCLTKVVIDTWQGFKKTTIEFEKDPEKFCKKRGIDVKLLEEVDEQGIPVACKPSLPKYLNKEKGRYVFVVSGHSFKELNSEGGLICRNKRINKIYKDTTGEDKLILQSYKKGKDGDNLVLKQVRVVPKPDAYMLEFVYEVSLSTPVEYENKYRTKAEREEQAKNETISDKAVAIKFGINDFITIVNNFGKAPIIFTGDVFKPIIDEFVEEKARLSSIAKSLNGVNSTKRIQRLSFKLTRQTKYLANLYSRYVVNWCLEQGVQEVILAKTKGMKKNISSKYAGLIPTMVCESQLIYKLEEVGINVKDVSSKSTKNTSFLDLEPVETKYEDKSRIQDNTFTSNTGIKLDASINTTYQIMRKRYANAFSEEDIDNICIVPECYSVIKNGSMEVVKVN